MLIGYYGKAKLGTLELDALRMINKMLTRVINTNILYLQF